MVDSIAKSPTTKEVEHYKTGLKLDRCNVSSARQRSTNNRWTWSSPFTLWHDTNFAAGTVIGQIGFTPSYPKTVSQLRSEALQKFHGDNVVNTALNVIEFPSLIRTLSQIKNTLGYMRQGFIRKGLGSDKQFLKVLNSLPSLHLGYSFGIAPLISDIKRLNRLLPALQKSAARARDQARKKFLVSSRCEGTFVTSMPGGFNGYYGESSPPSTYTGVNMWHGKPYSIVQPELRVVLRGRNDLRYNTSVFNTMDHILRKFVSTGPATLAWELVPFSFVVDWFVNTQSVLTELDSLLMGGFKNVIEGWQTERYHLVQPVVLNTFGSWEYGLEGSTVGSRYVKKYHRKPITTGSSIISNSRFGKKQAALSLSLLHGIVASLSR